MKRMLKQNLFFLVFCMIFLLCFSTRVSADSSWITLTWENDFLAHEDSGYTNGGAISWGYGPFGVLERGPLPNWLEVLVSNFTEKYSIDKITEMSYRVAQTMYTPKDIAAFELIENDRPYVGMILANANLHSYNENVSDRFWFTLGMVGPISGSEHVQKSIHKLVGKKRPNGWQHQLKNEPIFDLSAERLWRMRAKKINDSLEYDLVGISAGDLGTLRSELGLGMGFRLGRALSRSFMAALVIPGRTVNPLAANLKNEWHLFVNFYGRYVFNDIVLDGNTFQDSHSVTLTHEQLLVAIGASYHARLWGIVASIQDGSRFFEEREENGFFASLSYTHRW